ncbi:MAG: undecaprenyldiphospho-muramoylpentapeptide beta-N-acetylglucosaminyltransferase [Patescibacteria group bacterium]
MIRIVLTGGGTGGHIYPLIAVLDELEKTGGDVRLSIIYLGPKSGFIEMFRERGVRAHYIASSKLRRYASLENFIDAVKFPLSLIQALWHLYWIMPEVVFSKGGPGALAVVLAAWFYRIPVMIHESDSMPGLTSRISASFSAKIGIAFQSAASYFPLKKVALVGNPVRADLLINVPDSASAKSRLGFRNEEPLILVLGGSQGSRKINEFIFNNLEAILKKYQIFHQVGDANIDEAQTVTEEVSVKTGAKYRIAGMLDTIELKNALKAADIVISRAGSGAIYELAAFGKPSILIPLSSSAGDHQRYNALEYSKSGAAIIIEENNFTANVFLRELDDVLNDTAKMKTMGEQAKAFFRPDAGSVLASELLRLAGARG